MVKRLKRKFIMTAMLCVFGVIFIIVVALNAINVSNLMRVINHTADIIIDNGGILPKFDNFENNSSESESSEILPVKSQFFVRFITFYYSENGELINYETNDRNLNGDEISDVSASAKSKQGSGWQNSFRYYVSSYNGGYMVILIDGGYIKYSINSVLAISVSVAIGSLAVIFALLIIFSGKAVRPASEAYEKQKQFVTDAGHEFKTPLTVISVNSEILTMNYGENKWLKSITNQTEKLKNLVNDLISLSKLDEEKSEIINLPFDISDAVYDTACSFSPVAEKDGKKIVHSIEEGVIFKGDEAKTRQLVAIIIDNAVKYGDNNKEITVTLIKSKNICLTVENYCSYASEIETDKMFDRFYKSDKSRNSGSGYGLGLCIAKAIVLKHNGSIRADKIKDNKIKITVNL